MVSPILGLSEAAARSTTAAKLVRQLGGDLEHIVARALRKEPGQRYVSVDAFAEDLREWTLDQHAP